MSDNSQHRQIEVTENESVACNKVRKSRRILWLALAAVLSVGATVGSEAYKDAKNRAKYKKIDLRDSIEHVIDDYLPKSSTSDTNNDKEPIYTSPSDKTKQPKKKAVNPDKKVKKSIHEESPGTDIEPEVAYT